MGNVSSNLLALAKVLMNMRLLLLLIDSAFVAPLVSALALASAPALAAHASAVRPALDYAPALLLMLLLIMLVLMRLMLPMLDH